MGYTGTSGLIEAGGRALDANSFQFFAEAVSSLTLNAWSHIAAKLDYVARTIELFHNGVSVGTSGTLTGWTSGNTSDTDSLTSSIASQHGSTGELFDGDCDDCRLYNRLLTADEIRTIYTAQGGDGIISGLFHRYTLREASPGTAATAAGSIKNVAVGAANGNPSGSPVYSDSRLRRFRRSA